MAQSRKPTVEWKRLRVLVCGAVQGVGFRPFIYRLASEMALPGWVSNSSQGVTIEIEGPVDDLRHFLGRIENEKPPRSSIESISSSYLDAVRLPRFEIRDSESRGSKTAVVLPDIATCADCLMEVFDPGNRRYRYPFTNCTNCGPRYSIIESLPYDRPNTAMKRFTMCADCAAEYADPLNRRFHAQPNACPVCGPRLEYWDIDGSVMASEENALTAAVAAIRDGRIVAVKGLGGFHLMVNAANDDAVSELRKRKHREEKPLALMMPSLGATESYCEVSPLERKLLESPERPIVILKRKYWEAPISQNIAPGNPYLGCMLPYTPLHHLLMNELDFPVVATSGNLSGEPICIDEGEALSRLSGIVDEFLVHNRPIVRHVDDSIVRVMCGRMAILRRARGFAPLPVERMNNKVKVLAVGAHLKNTIAASVGRQTFVSQHIGDLETSQARAAFEQVIDSLDALYGIVPEVIACDAHPDYSSTGFAQAAGLPLVAVQHHYAHVLACMAENRLEPPVLGIAWDGTGYGNDGTIWGGEFLRIGSDGFERAAHFRAFPLPGGEKAVREPRRVALGALYIVFGEDAFSMPELGPFEHKRELTLLKNMLAKGINCPLATSAGRLFDAVASIIGLRHIVSFEGHAAMELEFAIDGVHTDESYTFKLSAGIDKPIIVDWAPALREIVADVRSETSIPIIAARFHNMMAETIVAVSIRMGEPVVALSGGCFQNKYLLERAVQRLEEEGFKPYWHQRVPTNDGGICLGQTLAADRFVASRDRDRTESNRRSTAICV